MQKRNNIFTLCIDDFLDCAIVLMAEKESNQSRRNAMADKQWSTCYITQRKWLILWWMQDMTALDTYTSLKTKIYYHTVYEYLHSKYYVIPNSTGNSSDACCNGGQLTRKKGFWCSCRRGCFEGFHFFCGSVSSRVA